MALSSALINKADYLQRKSNLELRQMQLGDLVQRKLDQIKIIQQDTKRVTNAMTKWNDAIKGDEEGDGGLAANTKKRQAAIDTADWKFATRVGVQDGDNSVYKITDCSASTNAKFDNVYDANDNTFLSDLQHESDKLELEKESVDSQLSQIDAMLKSLDSLEQSAAQDNPLWAIGGG